MWTLTGFADEISPELERQLETLGEESIGCMELRSVWNTNVLDLSDDELDRVKSAAAQRGIGISSIGSPIGKVPVTEPLGPHLERFRRALHAADVMETPYIRVFSFFIPEGHEPGHYREEVLDRMGIMAGEAEDSGVTLLHENEKEIYGDVPSRCVDILDGVGSPALRAAWDAANFVQCGVSPYDEGYASLRPYIEYVHVKDALYGSDTVVPAGEGDGQLPETLSALRASGFGDRLGLATPGHVRALRAARGGLAPIFAQQSIREMERTGRNPQEVLDDATWGVFAEGWQGGFGADADHLKTAEDIDACVAAGYSFFTFDPGEYVDDEAEASGASVLRTALEDLPWRDLEDLPADLKKRYLDAVMETAGLYNTAGFDDDTRAFASIPSRHDVWRRITCDWLAGMVLTCVVDEEEATDMAREFTYGLAKRAYGFQREPVGRA